MRALLIRCATQKASVKCLKNRLEIDGDRITKYKESMPTLNTKVNTQKARINELEKSIYQVDELTKENTNLTNLHKQMDKAKADAINEFQTPQPYYDELGDQYAKGFYHFYEQALLIFLKYGLDFSLDKIIPLLPR